MKVFIYDECTIWICWLLPAETNDILILQTTASRWSQRHNLSKGLRQKFGKEVKYTIKIHVFKSELLFSIFG